MMDEVVVSEILEEVSPKGSRGKAGLRHVTKSGCNELSVEEFDTVTVSRSLHRCEPTNEAQEL
jgi:hypothetical protein